MSLVLLFLAGPVLPGSAAADSSIDRESERVAPAIIEIRHQIHQHPELSNREYETSKLVAEHLRTLGLKVTTEIAHTGVVAVLKGGRPGPVVAVRADMDALPVTEETSLPFRSTVRTTYLGKEVGVMHACGHDVHIAVQLGVADVLAAMRDRIPGTVKFIFQPAEEGVPRGEDGGAEMMVRQKALENPRPGAIFGLHTYAEMKAGTIGYTVGPAFAAVDHFYITINGKQAHGASPHFSIDPIVMGSQVVTALQTIRSRNLPPLAPSVLTVGIFDGGQRFNIIPEQVTMEGTVRTYDGKVRDTVERRMGEILDGITKAGGCSFQLQYDRVTPATINNPALVRMMLPTLKRVVGDANVMEIEPTMGGEDFAYFSNEIPGFYFRLGQVREGTTSGGHHTPTFRADDSAIPVGIRAMASVVMDYLEAGGLKQ
ncbi:MAG: M20 family metallopeptidase [Acidobacteriota bacterium]